MNKKCKYCKIECEKSRCNACSQKENDQQKELYNNRLSMGLCPKCGDEPAKDKKCCLKCVKYICEKDKRVRLKRSKNNLCIYCGKLPPLEKRKHCQECLEKHKIMRDSRHLKLINRGLCTLCTKNKSLDGGRWCFECHLKRCSFNYLGDKDLWKSLLNKLENQNYTCPYTGDKIVVGLNDSIDHIWPSGKYPELKKDINNLQWVVRGVNKIKWDHTEEEFKTLIKKIHDHLKL